MEPRKQACLREASRVWHGWQPWSGHGCSAWQDTDDIMSDFPVFPEGAEGKTIPILCAVRVFHDSGMEEPERREESSPEESSQSGQGQRLNPTELCPSSQMEPQCLGDSEQDKR